MKISDPDKSTAYEHWSDAKHRIERISWDDFFTRAVQANEAFLDAEDRVRKEGERFHGSVDRS